MREQIITYHDDSHRKQQFQFVGARQTESTLSDGKETEKQTDRELLQLCLRSLARRAKHHTAPTTPQSPKIYR